MAKGILILCLLYGHMLVIASWEGYNSLLGGDLFKVIPFYNAFFMPTFFFITGYCSNFQIPFPKFIWKNVKTLIIPSIILGVIGSYIETIIQAKPLTFSPLISIFDWIYPGGAWFIVALFWSKMAYWVLARPKVCYQLIFIAFLYFIGLLLDSFDIVANIQWHRHSLLLLPFLFLGHMFRRKELCQYNNGFIALFAALVLLIQTIAYNKWNYPLPMLDLYIQVDYLTAVIHIINVCLGTYMVLFVSKHIPTIPFLTTLGKGSLIAYILNGTCQIPILMLCAPLWSYCSTYSYLVFYILSYIGCVGLVYLIIKLFYSNKYLKILLGKW